MELNHQNTLGLKIFLTKKLYVKKYYNLLKLHGGFEPSSFDYKTNTLPG